MALQLHKDACFPSWLAFVKILRAYEDEKHVLFKRGSSKSVEKWNSEHPNDTPLDKKLKYKKLVLECKSGGHLKPSESKGERPNQRTLNLGCKAQISLTGYSMPQQRLTVSIMREIHCHETTEEFVALYPENRRVGDEDLKVAAAMLDCRGKAMDIRLHLQKTTGKKITQKDFSNMQQKIKKLSKKGDTAEEDLQNELEHMCSSNPGSSYTIGFLDKENDDALFVDDVQTARPVDFLIFQTAQMKQNVHDFPEVIGLDTTYNTNKHNMHLSVMQVIDNHGNGRIAAYILLRRETNEIVEASLAVFVKANPEPMSKVKTVLVDKDYKEISGIKKVLPNVHVHLCHTHVQRIFDRKSKGEPNFEDVKNVLKKMSVSDSPAEFENYYENLKTIASTNFIEYFDKYWKDIDSAWVLYVRNESLSLGIRSTNHVESHNGKIKSVVSKSHTIADLVRELLKLHQARESDSAYKDFRDRASRPYIVNNKDSNIQTLLDKLSDWGARLLTAEYKQSFNLKDAVQPDNETSCTCNFCKKFDIGHCRHIFYQRRLAGEDVLDTTKIPPRWLKLTESRFLNKENSESSQTTSRQVNVQTKRAQTTSTGLSAQDQPHRFRKAKTLTDELADLTALTGGRQYISRMKLLGDILTCWKSKRECAVLPVSVEGVVDVDFLHQEGEQNPSPIHLPLREDNLFNPVGNSTMIPHSDPGQLSPENSQEINSREKCKDFPVSVNCHNCKTAATRSITRTGNHIGRYKYECGCGFFRWEKCGICQEQDVREGHYEDILNNSRKADSNVSRTSSIPCSQNSGFFDSDSNLIIDPTPPDDDFDTSSSNSIVLPSQEGSEVSQPLNGDEFQSILTEDASEENGKSDDHSPADCDRTTHQTENISDLISDINSSVEIEDSNPQADVISEENIPKKPDFILPQVNHFQGAPKPHNTINQEIRRNKGKAIMDEDVTTLSDCAWLVVAQSDRDRTYRVIERQQLCKISACIQAEPPCQHLYTCSCIDYRLHKCPCKHIYKIHELRKQHEDATKSDNGFNIVESHIPSSFTLPQHNVQGHPRTTIKKAAKKKKLSLSQVKSVRDASLKNLPTNCKICKKNMDIAAAFDCVKCKKQIHFECGKIDQDTDQFLCEDCLNKDSTIVLCNYCDDPGSHTLKCTICSKSVHKSTSCSIPTIYHGKNIESKRVCRKCICTHCKLPRSKDHNCTCHSCKLAIKEGQDSFICESCLQIVHSSCTLLFQHDQTICKTCFERKETGLSSHDVEVILSSDEMLSDVHINKALLILQHQFPNVDGLKPPVTSEADLILLETDLSYMPVNFRKHYVQIINTGHEHWVTCVIPKGSKDQVLVLNSTGSKELSSFSEQQLAAILRTQEVDFSVLFPKVQLQGYTMDCGPLAVAFATEFCFTQEVYTVEFDVAHLRTHLLQCLLSKEMTVFPAKRSKIKANFGRPSTVPVYCSCRMPENFDTNMVKCSKCKDFFHFKCEGLLGTPQGRRWTCTKCSSK